MDRRIVLALVLACSTLASAQPIPQQGLRQVTTDSSFSGSGTVASPLKLRTCFDGYGLVASGGVYVCSAAGLGDITSVVAGVALTGGCTSGDCTLDLAFSSDFQNSADTLDLSNTVTAPGSLTVATSFGAGGADTRALDVTTDGITTIRYDAAAEAEALILTNRGITTAGNGAGLYVGLAAGAAADVAAMDIIALSENTTFTGASADATFRLRLALNGSLTERLKITSDGTTTHTGAITTSGLFTATSGGTTPVNWTTTGTGDLVSADDLSVGDDATITDTLGVTGIATFKLAVVKGTNGNTSPSNLAAIEFQTGRDAGGTYTSGQTVADIALDYGGSSGGYRHWIEHEHSAGSAAQNVLNFYVNSSLTAGGSSAPGTGNVKALSLQGDGAVLTVGPITENGSAVLSGTISSNVIPRGSSGNLVDSAMADDGTGVTASSRSYIALSGGAADEYLAVTNTGTGGRTYWLVSSNNSTGLGSQRFTIYDTGVGSIISAAASGAITLHQNTTANGTVAVVGNLSTDANLTAGNATSDGPHVLNGVVQQLGPATPATSNMIFRANGLGAISILNYAADNLYLGFDVDFSGGGWVARDTTVAQFQKAADEFKLITASGQSVNGSVGGFNNVFVVDLTTSEFQTNFNTQLGDASTDRVGIGIAPDSNHAMTFAQALGPKIAFYPVDASNAFGIGVQSATLQIFASTDDSNNRVNIGRGDSDAFTGTAAFEADGQVFIGDTTNTAVNNNLDVLTIGNTGTGQTSAVADIKLSDTGSWTGNATTSTFNYGINIDRATSCSDCTVANSFGANSVGLSVDMHGDNSGDNAVYDLAIVTKRGNNYFNTNTSYENRFGGAVYINPGKTLAVQYIGGYFAALGETDGAGLDYGLGTWTAPDTHLHINSGNSTGTLYLNDTANDPIDFGAAGTSADATFHQDLTAGDDNTDTTTIWGHTKRSGTTPTPSSCGTSVPANTGTDAAGVFTTGTGGTTCTLTFSRTFTNEPSCIIQTRGSATQPTCTVSATAITCTTTIAATKYHYQCEEL